MLLQSTFGLIKYKLYDSIDCNFINKINQMNIETNDYILTFKNNTYNMIDISNNRLYNINRMYCTEKYDLTLYLNCEQYTIFKIYSSEYVVNNMILNVNHHINNKLNDTIYLYNNNIICLSELDPEYYYPFKMFMILFLVLKICWC